MVKRFDDFEKDDCCPECGLPMSECGCEPNEEQKCDCGKPECNCGTEEIKETKSFNDFFVNEDYDDGGVPASFTPEYDNSKEKIFSLEDMQFIYDTLVFGINKNEIEESLERFKEWLKKHFIDKYL